MGSIFDAQPTELSSNIHAVSNPDELVIGYISASSVEEKRFFIDYRDVPQWGYGTPCQSQLVANNPEDIKLYFPYRLLPYDAKREGLVLVGYYSSTPSCTDCTLLGGSLQRPSFW